MRIVWKFIRGMLAFIGLVVVGLAVWGAVSMHQTHDPMPDKVILAYTFYGSPEDAPAPTNPLVTYFMPGEPTLAEVTDSLYAGAKDPKVVAFVAQLSGGDYRWADVQELRDAIAAFRASGKKTYVFAESYGELYPGMAEYYLASAFDEIWLQPVGTVAITGFHAEVPYFKGLLAKLGIVPDIIQKGDYKTAPESALLEHMSEAQRTTLHQIMSSMMTDFFDGVSAGRKIPAARLGQLIDGAPYTADEAKERNLVDRVGYIDELTDMLIPDKKSNEKGYVNAVDYFYEGGGDTFDKVLKEEKQLADKTHKKNSVALVYVSGLIVSDDMGQGDMWGERMALAHDLGSAIMDAAEDEDIAAIVVRVDSPGGSPSASEAIRRAIEVAKQKGKYVVVSMGSEAASGGYWVSVDADKIFAQAGTLTGSIGVFGGKATFAELSEKAGVNWDSVQLGENSGMWSPAAPYTETGRASVNRMMDDVYNAFIERVAKGRNFSPEVVEGMAGGRVWTGRQAKERGLVDEIGGLRQAMADVAKKIGAKDVDSLDVILMPEDDRTLEEVFGSMANPMGVTEWLRPLTQSLVLQRNPGWNATRMDNGIQVWH